MLLDAEKDSKQYDLEISQLQLRVLQLQEEQKLLDKHVERLKSLSAPIRRLPVEILTQIFVTLCESNPTSFTGLSS